MLETVNILATQTKKTEPPRPMDLTVKAPDINALLNKIKKALTESESRRCGCF